MEKGFTHIYYGNGKGKTSAAIGLAIRAAGSGLRVHITRFLKDSESGELNVLKNIENITVADCPAILPFYFQMSEKQKNQYKSYATTLFNNAKSAMESGDFDVIVLDEILDVIEIGIILENQVIEFLKHKSNDVEIVITGHNASNDILSLADYVSNIVAEKHPYENGEAARKGIEY